MDGTGVPVVKKVVRTGILVRSTETTRADAILEVGLWPRRWR